MSEKCQWCGKEGRWPMVCENTRDIEDNAINGNDLCWKTLQALGGAEKGLRYVALNREAFAREATPDD